MRETRAERGEIIGDYLRKSVQLNQKHGGNLGKAYFRLAQCKTQIYVVITL